MKAVRVWVDGSIADFTELRVQLYIWLRDAQGPDSMWNRYLQAVLNDTRVCAYLEKQHYVCNRLGHHLTLISLLLNVIIDEKRLLPAVEIVQLWRCLTGDDNANDEPFDNLTTDAKLLLASWCIQLQSCQNKKLHFLKTAMLDVYDRLKRCEEARHQNWMENTDDVTLFPLSTLRRLRSIKVSLRSLLHCF